MSSTPRIQNPNPTRQLEMLVQIARLLSTLDLDHVLTTIIRLTTDAVNAAQGSFFLLDETGEHLQRFIAAREIDPAKRDAVSSRILKSGLASWVINNQRSALVYDTVSDPRWVNLDNEVEFKRVRSVVCVPFFVDVQLRGVMTLEHPDQNHFSESDLQLVEAAANQAANVLRNAQLFDRVQAQQRQLEVVLNSIMEILLVVDSDWRLHLFNPEARAFIGHDADALAGQRLDEISRIVGNNLYERLMQRISADARPDQTLTFETRDEVSKRDFTVHAAPLNRTDPHLDGYVIALHDISSLKDLNRLKTHMIQMASHDLKNPIGVLKGYLDVMKADADEGVAPDPMFFENMYKAIARMESLIMNLLDIQKAEGESPLRRDTIDPHALIDTVLDDMAPTAQRRGHRLVRELPAGLRSVTGDFARLREVMNNLVENAIKYTPDGGTITVRANTDGSRFSFQVQDTGYGIPDDKQSQVFQPYFRAQQKGTEHVPGTGIGLSLVKEIIERHGGQVWFSSKTNVGSTFGFWLPLLS